jgi:formylglycine-generating enzyme required for sulfatase activity
MLRWFLSYHSPDEGPAKGLKAAIEAKRPDAEIFFSPLNLRAGGFWQRALAEEIAEADAFILFVGKSGVGKWQELEYYAALDRRAISEFPLVMLLLDGYMAPGLPFLRQLHWIVTPDPFSERGLGRLIEALATGSSDRPRELWRFTNPYRGLAAMEEKDSDYFFGREGETIAVLSALSCTPKKLPIIIGNSGVGKSSLAQAGVLAALKRQQTAQVDGRNSLLFQDSRQWCFLTLKPGAEPLKALARAFLDTWQFDAANPERLKYQSGWIDLLRDEQANLSDLLDATESRYKELNLSEPPAFFLYVDQGEELYARGEKHQSRRFSELVAQALDDPRFHTMMSMRADFFGELQKDNSLFRVREQIDIVPLGEEQLREIVSRPASELSARFESPSLVDIITRKAAEDSVDDVGALPLLSYTLDDMWTEMVKRADGVLRLPAQSFELGGVLVDRADRFLATHSRDEDALRRILTLHLAKVHEDGEPTRRRAHKDEFSEQEWQLVGELANHPNRLLVTLVRPGGETYAEVAHEALFRRWTKLREWIAGEREFLAWKGGLESARRTWETTPDDVRKDALLMGAALAKAESWLAKRKEDLTSADRTFVQESLAHERAAKARIQRFERLLYAALVVIILGLLGMLNRPAIEAQMHWWAVERPYMLREITPYVKKVDNELALKPGQPFKECAKDCPEMIVVPAGEFTMGSPTDDHAARSNEMPAHKVKIAEPFAVGKYAVTFDDWDVCARVGDCSPTPRDHGLHQQPVVYISVEEARKYALWFSKMTGKKYRLLSEAEWEYVARAGTETEYYWGDGVGNNHANCKDCGSNFDGKQTAPVNSFTPNSFGLYNMFGNVLQWTDDCYRESYKEASTDVSASCNYFVIRGGGFDLPHQMLRSAHRSYADPEFRNVDLGFRVARTLAQ